MSHGGCVDVKVREFQVTLFDLMGKKRIGLRRNPMPKNSPELAIEGFQAMRADHMKGKRASKIEGVIHGEKEGDEVGNVVRVKMGDTEIINPAIIETHPDHLPQRPASSIKKNKVRTQG
jgi:hypothetical protein